MRALIRGLRAERTVILSTHILPEVEATCDRVIIIHRGRVLALDTPANLNRRLRPTSQVYVEVRGPAAEVRRARCARCPACSRVERRAGGDGVVALTVSTERDRDLREAARRRRSRARLGLARAAAADAHARGDLPRPWSAPTRARETSHEAARHLPA